MHPALLRSLIGSGFVLFNLAAGGLAASPQSPSSPIATPYYSQDEIQMTHSMFDKVQTDLSRAQTNASPSNDLGDAPRFDIARAQLAHLEQSWDQARFDSGQISAAISALQMVLRDNHLLGHDQEVLSADLSQLLDFQTAYYGPE